MEISDAYNKERYSKLVVLLTYLTISFMCILSTEAMTYKQYLKKGEIISTKVRIIKSRIIERKSIQSISKSFCMHRNSVRNIMDLYYTSAGEEFRRKIEYNESFSLSELETLWSFLLPRSRRPYTHSRQANIQEELLIESCYAGCKIGAKRMYYTLQRREKLWTLTLAQIRWVYKRKGYKVQKVRTKNRETRSLYNYETLWAFEHGHYDTKEIADMKSLPSHIYENFKHNPHLPLYEWNIIFAGCRVRFTGYSRGKNSSIGLQFVIFVLSHLRSCGVWGYIYLHTDGGAEFFSGSKNKQGEWNSILHLLDASIDCYNPNWDVRKNLIERSHRSDDEEFLIPFGEEMETREVFMKHAQSYNDFWNKTRSHSGKGMKYMTPREKILKLWFHQADKILDFPVLYLDSYFYILQRHLEYFLFLKELTLTPLCLLQEDRKVSLALITKYSHLRNYAQNVLTYYQIKNLSFP